MRRPPRPTRSKVIRLPHACHAGAGTNPSLLLDFLERGGGGGGGGETLLSLTHCSQLWLAYQQVSILSVPIKRVSLPLIRFPKMEERRRTMGTVSSFFSFFFSKNKKSHPRMARSHLPLLQRTCEYKKVVADATPPSSFWPSVKCGFFFFPPLFSSPNRSSSCNV